MTCWCKDEQVQKSQHHSFGPVRCGETVLIAGVHPLNYQDGELLTSAFDDRKLRKADVSVCRRDHSSMDEFRSEVIAAVIAKGAEQSPPQARMCEMGFLALCKEIRSVMVEGANVGAFCVIDDGLETFPSHALLSFSDHIRNDPNFWNKQCKRVGKHLKAAVIANLTELFNANRVPVEECFAAAAGQ